MFGVNTYWADILGGIIFIQQLNACRLVHFIDHKNFKITVRNKLIFNEQTNQNIVLSLLGSTIHNTSKTLGNQ